MGDIAPGDGVSKEAKAAAEEAAMATIRAMLGGAGDGAFGAHLQAWVLEYEVGETAEARFVKDLDKAGEAGTRPV